MKKLLFLCLTVVLSLSCLTACNLFAMYDASEKNTETEEEIKGLDKAAKIEVTQYDIGIVVDAITVTEAATINHIVDNLTSLTLKKRNGCEPIALEYELTFYNKDGERIKVIDISLDGLVDYNSVISGELDKTYLAGLFE